MPSWSPSWHHQQMAVFWIAIVLGLVVAVYLWRGRLEQSPGSAEETLRQRYARGEIDEETYERMLEELRK